MKNTFKTKHTSAKVIEGFSAVHFLNQLYGRNEIKHVPIIFREAKGNLRGPKQNNHKGEGKSQNKKVSVVYVQPEGSRKLSVKAPLRPEIFTPLTAKIFAMPRFNYETHHWEIRCYCKQWMRPEIYAAMRLRALELKHREIAEILGRTLGSAASKINMINKKGSVIPTDASWSRWSPEEEKILCKMKELGYSNAFIARALARTPQAVYMKYRSL